MNQSHDLSFTAYFAAANSYKGFVSYFDKIFDPKNFDKIFIIKGGPGTGKSSLMKKIAALGSEKNYKVEKIYCSSDPESLDGIILTNNRRRIGLLDGTAPHQRDPIIPGAVEQIIDLGKNWNARWLEAEKDKIKDLITEKRNAYNNAYSYLKIAGASASHIKTIYTENFNEYGAKFKAESLLKDNYRIRQKKRDTKILSAFGKNGIATLSADTDKFKQKIEVSGDEYSTALFMNTCQRQLRSNGGIYTVSHTPLDEELTECIALPFDSVLICSSKNGKVDSTEFIKLNSLKQESIKKARQLTRDALDEAQRWFLVASDFHFRLEEIYSRAMDFEKNDMIFLKTWDEICEILEKCE